MYVLLDYCMIFYLFLKLEKYDLGVTTNSFVWFRPSLDQLLYRYVMYV